MFKVTYKSPEKGVEKTGIYKEIPSVGDQVEIQGFAYKITNAKFFPEHSNSKITAVEFSLQYDGYLH